MNSGRNSNNFEEKRRVTIAPLFSLLALFLSLLMIFYPFFKDFGREPKKITKAKLESVAYQIATFEKRKVAEYHSNPTRSRVPASYQGAQQKFRFGTFGADHHGKPMNYEIQEFLTHIKVSVWPAGDLQARTEVLIPNE